MPRELNEAQRAVLLWIQEGHPAGVATNAQRLSARVLANRGLAKIVGRGPAWSATLSEAGHFYAQHGCYPADMYPAAAVKAREAAASPPPRPPELEVDSPRGARRRGLKPRGDALFSASNPDPYDEKILITVKEAAWMLALPEGAIRRAVVAGDLDRVFFGDGERNYRIVYGSLLAWVNDMPRESAHNQWWGRR